MSTGGTPGAAGGRIRPLARRLDSLAGSPTSSSSAPKAPPPVIRPRSAIGSSNSSSGGQDVYFSSQVKSQSDVKDDPEMSVKDMLAQAKRKEAALLSKQEKSNTLSKRNITIRTDVSAPAEQRLMEASFLADTVDDIELEGNEAVSISDRGADDRCFPVKIPFAQHICDDNHAPITLSEEIMLVQLPSLFPTLGGNSSESAVLLGKRGQAVKSAPPKSAAKQMGTPFSDIPDGQLGTIKIHKSGKHVLHVGNTQFLVKEGQKVNFRTEVACVCPGENEIIFLGQAEKRLVVTPVIHSPC